jgi:hypothetical protein
VGFGVLSDWIGVPFNPDDRQDDDRRGLIQRGGAAEPHDAALVGEFDNGAHQPLSSDCQQRTPCPDPRMSASS